MDDENRKNQADTDTDPMTESSCSWSQQSQNSDSIANAYFFGTAGGGGGDVSHTNLFTDFGWSLPFHQQDEHHGYGEFDRIAGNNPTNPTATSFSASDGGGGEVEPQRMVSSSSSEDKGEKSTASGGSTSRLPSDTTASKVKKKGQKRVRQPRFAFMTKSEVDHLEDGYRWRKYGQKAVKNSPYPRSYYRCTNTKCTVKKRVERSSEDPTTVITTYEGQHCHHTVGFPRNTSLIINPEITFPAPSITTPSNSPQMYYPAALGMHFSRHSAAAPINSDRSFRYTGEGGESHLLPEINLPSSSTTDEGLLGDIVPHGMRNS